METAVSSSLSSVETRILLCASTHSRTTKPISVRSSSNPRLKFSPKAFPSTSFTAPFVGGSVSGELSGNKLSVPLLRTDLASGRRGKRGVVTMVRYHSRKRLAEQRPRVRGQFVRQPVQEPNKDREGDS